MRKNDFLLLPGKVPNTPNTPRLLSVKTKENELKIDVETFETEASGVKESEDKVLEFEPRKSLFSDDEDIIMK